MAPQRTDAQQKAERMTDRPVASPPSGRLVRYMEAISRHRYATWVLAAIAFADSSILPLMPDLLLIPMVLTRPKQIWWLSAICTIASSLGAALGYLIGYELWSLFGARLVELYGYTESFAVYQRLVQEWGIWIIIAKAFTPIPFKIMAIAAGVAAMNPFAFMFATVVGRSLHFGITAGLLVLFGDRIMFVLARYERPLALISVLLIIGLIVAYHVR